MASTGNLFPGTGANDAGIGATAWVNPGNIVSDNATDASCTAAASSQYLVAKNFNFTSVPTNATIAGITVRIEAAESSTGSETLQIRLQNESAALAGSTKTASISGATPTVYTAGAVNDLWTLTPTPAQVHDIDWGVRFWYITAHNMTVDYVTMALEYTIPTPGLATETDTASALTVTKLVAVAQATETDTASAPTITKIISAASATETDVALAPTIEIVSGGQQVTPGLATEVDTAQAPTVTKLVSVGFAAESDTALARTITKMISVGLATETDTALALDIAGHPGGGPPHPKKGGRLGVRLGGGVRF